MATRAVALDSLVHKRTHLDGAGLFYILPRRRNRALLSLLVAYEAILEFLDDLDEHTVGVHEANGKQLHLALVEAVSPGAPMSDYYRYHPEGDDGGYLRAYVQACRQCTEALPCYPAVSDLVSREAIRAGVLALNHDSQYPADELKAWTEREFPNQDPRRWFELSGAATASLTVHALMALAAERSCVADEIHGVQTAYFPWVSLTATMLDSYVDYADDRAIGGHSYIGYYANLPLARERVGELIQRAARETLSLRRGHHHAVIVACMVAMYMSRDSARVGEMQETTSCFLQAGGSLTRLLLPVLRAWRSVHSLPNA